MTSDPLPPLPDLCYEGDPELLPAAEAWRRIAAAVTPVGGRERVTLREALGRVLAVEVVAPRDVPGHTNSAMDGYALAGTDLPAAGEVRLRRLGTAWAGRPFDGAVARGECVQVMTGAPIPSGTDTVVMHEQVRLEGETVVIGTGHRPGQNVRAAGEDLRARSTVLAPGHRLMPAELGLLASLGLAEITVHRRLRVACLSTGDELRTAGEPLDEGSVYDSNRFLLYGMLTRLGAEVLDLGVVRDRAEDTRAALLEASAAADVVITTGGASTGAADHVKASLDALGQAGFWRVAIRPGRPLAFGRIGDAWFFGLPGNPVAVMVTFHQFVGPALRRLMGEPGALTLPPLEAVTASRLRKKPGRVEIYRGVLHRDEAGRLRVRTTGGSGSGLLHTMRDANCFIVLPEEGGTVEPGESVAVQPFFGLL